MTTTTLEQRNQISIDAATKRLEIVCKEMVDLELERRQIKREIMVLGGFVLKEYGKHLGQAIVEIINLHHNGIRGSDIYRILKNEGFKGTGKSYNRDPRLKVQMYNILSIYHKRGVVRKLDIGLYAPSLDILDDVIK